MHPATETPRTGADQLFDAMVRKQFVTQLDREHERLIGFLQDNRLNWSWSAEHHILTTHTASLKKAHAALGLKGPFETIATYRNGPDLNCFCFPMQDGAWVVRRYGNAEEASTWSKDRAGYTRCYLNRDPAEAGKQ